MCSHSCGTPRLIVTKLYLALKGHCDSHVPTLLESFPLPHPVWQLPGKPRESAQTGFRGYIWDLRVQREGSLVPPQRLDVVPKC